MDGDVSALAVASPWIEASLSTEGSMPLADKTADNCVRRSRERESWPDIGDVKRKRNNLLRPWVSAKEERRKSVKNACLKRKTKNTELHI